MKRKAQGQNSNFSSKISKKDVKVKKEKEDGSEKEGQAQASQSIASDNQLGVITVYDRRINLQKFGENPSLFELCRAWVQDDPDRSQSNTSLRQMSRIGQAQTPPQTEYDAVIEYLSNSLHTPEKKRDFTRMDINSLEGIASRDILSLHILHFKKCRKIRRVLTLARYGRMAALNDSRADNFPLQELIARLAKPCYNDILLQELAKKLEPNSKR